MCIYNVIISYISTRPKLKQNFYLTLLPGLHDLWLVSLPFFPPQKTSLLEQLKSLETNVGDLVLSILVLIKK